LGETLADFHTCTGLSTLRRQILDEVLATGGFNSSCLDNLSILTTNAPGSQIETESLDSNPSPMEDKK